MYSQQERARTMCGIPWATLCLVMVIPFLPRCEACVHDERMALLDIGNELSIKSSDWWSDGPRDCCRWDGVTCAPRTGRVTGLSRSGDRNVDSGLLNATVFLPLQELRNLSLSYINIRGCIPGAGFEVLSKLHKLEILDLSINELNDISISSLVAISSIRSLFLNYNALSSSQTIQQLSIMQLETLDISGNVIEGTISTDICNMKNLQELHLRDNMLFGELPSCIRNLTSLRVLDLSNNLLTVKFPTFSFTHLKSLVKFYLANNNLEGNLLLGSLSNHSQLRHLELASSGNHFHLRTENPSMKFSAQLEVLVLRNCNLNGNFSAVQGFLLHQHTLEVIDISNNNLSGSFPSWLIENNTNLSFLILRGNSFSGPLFLPYKAHNNIELLDASCNRLSKLPIDFNITLPNLEYLNLSGNFFEGPFPSAFGYTFGLSTVDLSYNNFLDNIGAAFATDILNLFLSSNNFYGSLPLNFSNLFLSSNLMLNDNRITGEIPDTICDLDLTVVDFSDNEFTGSIPDCLDRWHTSLSILNLRGNSLVGSFPLGLCQSLNLVFVDLSKNYLSGPIDCLPNLKYLHLSENRFSGTFPFPLTMGTDMHTVDLRGNQFSGVLPWLIASVFPNLRVLLLGRNLFEGMIPNEICQLMYLSLLDLSHNKLSGKLPSCLSNIGSDHEFSYFQYGFTPLGFHQDFLTQYNNFVWQLDQEEFMTKSRHDFYEGEALNYMYGLDFSSNQLNGSIPESIGNMKWLLALNFSNNYLDGSIPRSLSNLSKLESLDLSRNNLAGQIPSELVALQYLEVFSVAYNNLSGPTLGTKGQFITFDESSYQGNPYLCGPPLLKSCSTPPSTPLSEEHGEEGDDIILFGCSAMFYLVGFWTSLGVLYFKTSWRWSWFSGVDRFGDFVMVKLSVFTRKI